MKGRDANFQSLLENLKKQYQPTIVQINSAKDRDNYLRKLDDDYTRFILEKLSEKKLMKALRVDLLKSTTLSH